MGPSNQRKGARRTDTLSGSLHILCIYWKRWVGFIVRVLVSIINLLVFVLHVIIKRGRYVLVVETEHIYVLWGVIFIKGKKKGWITNYPSENPITEVKVVAISMGGKPKFFFFSISKPSYSKPVRLGIQCPIYKREEGRVDHQ